jgi:hypothetical protein
LADDILGSYVHNDYGRAEARRKRYSGKQVPDSKWQMAIGGWLLAFGFWRTAIGF